VFVENSPMLTSRGLGRVLGDLAAMGFDARWGVLGAADVGANHQRDRIWIVGKATYPTSHRPQEQANECVMEGQRRGELQPIQSRNTDEVAYPREVRLCGEEAKRGVGGDRPPIYGVAKDWWDREPANVPRTITRDMGGMVDGVASRVDRLKAIGNGQVPLCAASAWRLLTRDWELML